MAGSFAKGVLARDRSAVRLCIVLPAILSTGGRPNHLGKAVPNLRGGLSVNFSSKDFLEQKTIAPCRLLWCSPCNIPRVATRLPTSLRLHVTRTAGPSKGAPACDLQVSNLTDRYVKPMIQRSLSSAALSASSSTYKSKLL